MGCLNINETGHYSSEPRRLLRFAMSEGQEADTSYIQRNSACSPRLIVLRGNSGSGKTTTALALRRRHPGRFVWLEQDNIRRVVLDEDGLSDHPLTAEVIGECARLALARGRDVILEGILDAGRYGATLRALHAARTGHAAFYFFSVPFDETVRRHATRPTADAFGRTEMAAWYREDDRLRDLPEHVISESHTLAETVKRIEADAHLQEPVK